MKIKLINISGKDQKYYLDKLNDITGTNIELLSGSKYDRLSLSLECEDIELYNEIIKKLKKAGCYIFDKKYSINPVDYKCIGSIEFTMDHNMLIVGNGFDLASGLKTRYRDFLESISKVLSFRGNNNNASYEEDFLKYFRRLFGNFDMYIDAKYQILEFYNSIKDDIKNDNTGQNIIKNKLKFYNINLSKLNNRDNRSLFEMAVKVLSYIMKNTNNDIFSKYPVQWALVKVYIEENTMIKYFLDIYNIDPISYRIQNNNWVDIESEMYKIISLVETTIKNINKEKKYILDNKEINQKKSSLIFFKSIEENPKKIFSNIEEGEMELDRFNFLLENYLYSVEREEKDETTQKENYTHLITDIKAIAPKITHLLSFNYTDTFRNKYYGIDDKNTDFIHGKIGEHNLVLGINETLDVNDESKMLDCIYFKKYFQRIYKKTGAKYSKWLKEVSFKTVYIFGHSLDVTDKEILKEIIDNDNVEKIVIYYCNKNHYRQEINNLIKILDKNNFLQYTKEGRIEFKKQSE